MALQLLESFDDSLYSSRFGTYNFTAPNVSYGLNGKGIQLGDTPNGYIYLPVDGTKKWIIGFHLYVHSVSGEQVLMEIGEVNQGGITIYYDSSNQRLHAETRVGVSSYLDDYTANGSVQVQNWHYVEFSYLWSTGSAGTFQMGVDGTYITERTGIDMYFSYSLTRIGWTTSTVVNEFWIDDLYTADTTGGVNDSFLGPVAITVKYPDGNGNYSNLTGSDGNSTDNYLLVDEDPPDDGTTYVESGTEGDEDTYTFDDVTGSPTIYGVVASMYSRRTQTGAKYLRAITRLSSTDYTGTAKSLATSYGVLEEVWDQNPNTSTAWTATTFNGAEFGAEVRNSV